LVGYNYSSMVSSCYSTGSSSGNSYVGGLAGYNNTSSTISSCYSTGSVSGSGSDVGGLVGENYSSTVSSSYYNSEISGQSSGIGTDNNNQTVTALVTSQMKQDSSFTDWNFTNTWKIDNNITFPRLINVNNAPVILRNLPSVIKTNETYTDTIQFVFMDNQKVSIELLSHPEGMTLTEDSIITYTPTSLINDTVGIRVTDTTGLATTYFYNINVIDLNGNGTKADPYQISSLDNLKELSEMPNILNKCFIQTADINASDTKNWDNGKGFFPIGNKTTKFTGNYNGQSYIVDSLTINRSTTNYIGLFGYTSGASIDSLGLINTDIQGAYTVGGLVGENDDSSTISYCYFTGSVSGQNYIGGLVGYNYQNSTISSCYSSGSVSGVGYIGGLVGFNFGSSTISSCYSTSSVLGTGDNVGGLLGFNFSSSIVKNCYSTGSVLGGFQVGALVGHNKSSSSIIASYYNIETSGQTSGIGYDDNNQTITALSINQMKQDSSFTDWDFTNTWTIDNNITFPRLINVNNAPIILQNLSSITKVNETYTDTIQFVFMDNQKVSIELLSHPEGMTLTEDSIITYTPTSLINDTVEIRVTDTVGLSNIYFYNINVIDLDGNGTATDPYKISSLDNLKELSEKPNILNKCFIQTADINASDTKNWDNGNGFLPIGNNATKFTGNYNGQSYIIDSLTINRSTSSIGLFGYTSGATIDSLGLTNINIQGQSSVGGLVGFNFSSAVSSCYSTGSISGVYYVGGLVGYNYQNSTISSCYSTGSISGVYYVGGLVGRNISVSAVNSCYSTGSVSGNNYIGGLVGWNYSSSEVNNCYSTGLVSGTGDNVGGLVGDNKGTSTVSFSYYNSETSEQTSGIGTDDNSQSVTALSINQMKQDSSFTGWDFTNTWGIRADSTYPALLSVRNNAPFAFADTLTITGRTSLSPNILNNDYDYETAQEHLCYKVITSPTKGSFTNGAYLFDDTVSIGNTDSLIYCIGEYASNDTLWGNRATIILTKVANTAPTLQSVNDTTIDEDDSLTLSFDDVVATDVDSDNLNLVILAGGNYTIDSLTITPDANFNGTLTVPICVSDGDLNSDTLNMTITVNAVNDAPVLTSVNDTTISEDDSLTLSFDDVVASDADSDSLSLIVTTTDTNCTITGTTVIPNSGFIGDIALLIAVTDGIDTSETDTMDLRVDEATSINEITPMAKDGYSLRVAPTPTRDAGKIIFASNVDGEAVFTIYTRNEIKLATMKRDVVYGEEMNFDWPIISKLNKGIYYIEMKVNGDRKAISRIVKINK